MQGNRHRICLYCTLLSIFPVLFIGIVFGLLSGCPSKSKQGIITHDSAGEKRIIVELPKIGEIITTDRALELCGHYNFNHLVKRIKDNPDLYKKWKFDGCSMTPDTVLSEILKVPSLTEICLRHDLGYAYGDPGNKKERKEVDRKFQKELLSAGANELAAKAMYDAVRVGGKEEFCLSFSWGFAWALPCKPGFGFKFKK